MPVYISIDPFWHWVKTIWSSRENRIHQTATNRHQEIEKLFQKYCNWDKTNDNYVNEMVETSKLFTKLLSPNNINYLTEKNAKKIYGKLHSGAMRTRRFNADQKFVKDNPIKKIKESLKYLLYSNDEIDLKIHNLCENPMYKLNQLNYSGTQEIIGWVNPEKYPIRNNKADEALKLLGFEIK